MKKLATHICTRIVIAVALFAASFACVWTSFAQSKSCKDQYDSCKYSCIRDNEACTRTQDHNYCQSQFEACTQNCDSQYQACIK
jgi:hypothetical protein